MEESSVPGAQDGRRQDVGGPQGQNRAEALAKATRRQFYDSDRVKQFHRVLLMTETLKEREEQIEMKQQMQNAANEETKKFMAQIRRKELEAVEQERARARRREKEKTAIADYVKQQLRDQEIMRQLRKLEREREVEECRRLREKYEREKAELRRTQQQEKESARQAYEAHLSMRDAVRAREAQKQEMDEERRRLADEEMERRMRKKQEEKMERYLKLQRHKENLARQLEAQLQEKTSKEEERNAREEAELQAQREADMERERRERAEKKAMLRAINCVREEQRRVQEQRVLEEQRIARDMLHVSKEADRAYWKEQELTRERKKQERSSVDEMLRQQMDRRSAEVQLARKKVLDFGRKNAQLLEEEEEHFQRYATEVIKAADEAKRKTLPLRKAARIGRECGLGPITGGMRSNYLLSSGPSHARMPNYISSTKQDIERLYASTNALDNRKIDFIW